MNRDLFLAILAMDSYNRGYDVGIKNLAEGGKLGNASIITTADSVKTGWEDVGFYALAYDMTGVSNFLDGARVISYRGTDKISIFGNGDILNGWLVGGGAQGGITGGAQAPLSIQFYKDVVGTDSDGDFTTNPFTNTITLTGHSLGGGLAGYVASLYGRPAEIFDNMPFELASDLTRLRAQANAVTGFVNAKDFVYGQYDITEIERSNITATAVAFEVLAALRASGGQQTPVRSVDTYGSALLNPATERHMMDLLVNLMWAEDNGKVQWQSAGVELWNAYFSEEVAASITGIESRKGTAGFAGVMGRMIAYSAIDEGEKPFGDTAIWSMFNDADELGVILAGAASKFFDHFVVERPGFLYDPDIDVKQTIANMLVQYAGALALKDVERPQGGGKLVEGGSVDVLEGILSRDTENSALALDLSRQLWTDALGGAAVNPIDRVKFRQAYFAQAENLGLWDLFKKLIGVGYQTEFSDSDLRKIASEVWGTANLDIFDRFHIAPTDAASTVTLDARSYLSNTSLGDLAQVDVYIGTAANEKIVKTTNGHYFIIGGDGNDDVDGSGSAGGGGGNGGGGHDLILGGDGNDVLKGLAGDDYLDGGDDNDSIEGGDGTDALYGGDGKDRLAPGKGTDTEVFGGGGDDLLIAEIGDGDDELDGGYQYLPSITNIGPVGDGTDTIVYKYYHGNGVITLLDASELNSRNMADFGLRISANVTGANGETGGFGNDSLSSIERAAAEAGDGADGLKITEDSQGSYIQYIDLGTQAAGQFDTIDLRTLTLGATVDLSRDSVKWESPEKVFGVTVFTHDYEVEVRNAEAALGGSGDDHLLAGVPSRGVPKGLQKPLAPVMEALGAAGRKALDDRVVLLGNGGDDIIVLDAGAGSLADGGEGNDILFAGGGQGTVAAGGLGQDLIVNRAKGGILWGDVAGSVKQGKQNYYFKKRVIGRVEAGGEVFRDGVLVDVPVFVDPGTQPEEIPDTIANRDVFWFAPDTVIMDAQNVDLLFYGGAPLTGGDAIAFSTLLQASNGGGSVFTLANIIAKSAEASLGEWVKQLGKKTKAGRPLTPVFFDTWLPFITYQIIRNTEGGVDLVIGNVSDALWNVGGKSAIYDPLKPDAAGYSYQGLMTVKNFDAAFGMEGSKQKDLKGKGDLGLVFKFYGANDFAGLITPEIAGPGGMSALAAAQTLAVADAMFTLSAAAERMAEALRWKAANDNIAERIAA